MRTYADKPFSGECKAGHGKMTLMFVADTGADPKQHYAFNVYRCETCDMIAKEDVWVDPNQVLWISNKNETSVEVLVTESPEAAL